MPGHTLSAQANARASRVECAVRGLRQDELEVASLRGEVCTLASLWYFVLLVRLLQRCVICFQSLTFSFYNCQLDSS